MLTCLQPTQNYYAPQIFSDMGLNERNSALFATGVYGLVKMLSSLCFLLFAADSLGRRRSLLISSVGMAVTLSVVGIYEKLYSGQKIGVSCSISFSLAGMVRNGGLLTDGLDLDTTARVHGDCVYLPLRLLLPIWLGPLLLDLCLRDSHRTIAHTQRRLGCRDTVANQLHYCTDDIDDDDLPKLCESARPDQVPNLFPNLTNLQGTWMLFGTFCALTFLFVFFLIPETKGMSLEKIDGLFGITDDLLRMMDESQRERTAGRNAAGEFDNLVPGSSYTATTVAMSSGDLDKRHTGSSRLKDEPVYRL